MSGVCGVVLAAGAGVRLRPLTLCRPKPLCPVANVPLIDLAIARVRPATPDVAVNLHHDREAIEAHLASGSPTVGQPNHHDGEGTAADGAGLIHISVEEDEPLGTAGALGHLRPWIDGRAVLVVNADTWCPGPLDGLVPGWDGERVRLLLAGDDRLRPTSRIAAALLPWPEVARLEPVPSGLYELSWRRLAAQDRIDAVRWDGPCLDCGTPARYLHANLVASGGAPVIEPGATVSGTLERSVLWRGAVVEPGEHLVDAIRTERLTVLVR